MKKKKYLLTVDQILGNTICIWKTRSKHYLSQDGVGMWDVLTEKEMYGEVDIYAPTFRKVI